jgi:hypothetical protein
VIVDGTSLPSTSRSSKVAVVSDETAIASLKVAETGLVTATLTDP